MKCIATGSLDPGAVVSETVSLADTSDVLARMTEYRTDGIPVITEFRP